MGQHTLKKYQENKIKLARLKELCEANFTNRTMLMLSGLEEIMDNPEFHNWWHFIDMANDLAVPELKKENKKPSKALAALAFGGPLRQEDYDNLIKVAQSATKEELAEFLKTEIEHEPKEKVIDYLSFPLLAQMAQNLPSHEKAELFLIKENLLSQTIPSAMDKTLKELLTTKDRQVLHSRAIYYTGQSFPKLRPYDLNSWKVHVSTKTGGQFLDLHTVEAEAHWFRTRKARETAQKTGYGLKMAQWEKKHHIPER